MDAEVQRDTQSKTIWLGAVAYDKKIVDVWEGMRSYLQNEAGLPVEVLLFLNYEAQAEALLQGRIDIAWNTNLAYLQCEAWSQQGTNAIAMRDTDRDWTTLIIAPEHGDVKRLEDLKGRTLALGSRDSGHAAVLPVHFLEQEGLIEGQDYQSLRFNEDVGKHGDTGTSEKDVLAAVLDGRADAGAVGSPFWQGMKEQGLIPGDAVKVVWTSEPYHHCMFTGRVGLDPEVARRFSEALYMMDWENPAHRKVLEDEGLRQWVPADTSKYDSLREAARRQGFFERRRGMPVVAREN